MGLIARARLSRRARARLLDERGFTLPELLITMAILLIVVGTLASVLVSATSSEMDANTRFEAQGQARAALDEMRREIHGGCSVSQTSGSALSPGVSYNAVSVTLPGSSCTTGVTYTTWCTLQSTTVTTDWSLYRVTSSSSRPACTATSKVKWADYLTSSTPFCLPDTSHACAGVLKPATSLPMLHVVMPVNLNGPLSTIDGYNLVDDIALRNGSRS